MFIWNIDMWGQLLTKILFMSLLSTTCDFNFILLQKKKNGAFIYLYTCTTLTEEILDSTETGGWNWTHAKCLEPNRPQRLISAHVMLACSLKHHTHQQTCVRCQRFTTSALNDQIQHPRAGFEIRHETMNVTCQENTPELNLDS